MYTDETMLAKGKYKFWKLKEVPPKYFLNIHENGGSNDPDLKEWIINNLERLQANKESFGVAPPVVPFICDKRTFPTQKDAKASLAKIRNVSGENQKPIRAYECPICSGWHLTSKEYLTSKELNNKIF